MSFFWALSSGVSRAQETIPNFHFDPVEHWAARILTWSLLLSMLVVCYAMVRVYRGHTRGFVSRGLLVAGVILLPAFSVSTGMLLVFPRAERVEFCGSCHLALGPYVADMVDEENGGLAAVHYRYQYIASDQCYECHTSYGLFGTFAAKVSGVGQVLRYYTGAYESPLVLREPYSNADCLKCHAQSVKWLSRGEHTMEGIRQALYADEVSCMDCHARGHATAEASGQEAG